MAKKAGEIVVTKAAIKKAIKTYEGKLSAEQIVKLSAMLDAYKEISVYLELLRETALKIKGTDIEGLNLFDSIDGENEEDL